ncbi:MAG TPA: hypothetical protein VEL28_03190 [Candidatus Binatia bacterium]|nr:hypothetical protein [Candidatus Binatia bacterium]
MTKSATGPGSGIIRRLSSLAMPATMAVAVMAAAPSYADDAASPGGAGKPERVVLPGREPASKPAPPPNAEFPMLGVDPLLPADLQNPPPTPAAADQRGGVVDLDVDSSDPGGRVDLDVDASDPGGRVDLDVDGSDPGGRVDLDVDATAPDAVSGDEAAAGQDGVAEDVGEDGVGEVQSGAASPIKVLGDGSVVLYLVDHSPLWSMHAEGVPADAIFRLWRGAGGPEVLSKQLIDHPFTMSVHRLSAERIVARILEGFNYTLQYRDGRLSSVHVISAHPTRMYKTPRLVEARSKWTETELHLLAVTGDSGGNDADAKPAPPLPLPVQAPPGNAGGGGAKAENAASGGGAEPEEEPARRKQRVPHRGAAE